MHTLSVILTALQRVVSLVHAPMLLAQCTVLGSPVQRFLSAFVLGDWPFQGLRSLLLSIMVIATLTFFCLPRGLNLLKVI